jgi:hypothetical protein
MTEQGGQSMPWRNRIHPVSRAANHSLAWILTGPIGRVVAFLGDLGAALGNWALKRAGLKRDPE